MFGADVVFSSRYLHYQDMLDNEWDAMAACPRYLRNEVTLLIVLIVSLFLF